MQLVFLHCGKMSASQTLDQAIALLDRLMGARPAGAAAAPQQPARAAAAPAANPGKPAKQEAAPAKPASTPAAAKPAKAPAVAAAAREPTAYGVFGKARIQVAKILNVEDIPNSEKLFKMQVRTSAIRCWLICGAAKANNHISPGWL